MVKRTDPDIVAWIEKRVIEHPDDNAATIHRDVCDPEEFGHAAVSIRKVRTLVNEQRVRLLAPDGKYESDRAPWSLADTNSADAALMLSMITEMVDDSAGSYPRISRGLARWMIRLRKAVGGVVRKANDELLPAGNIAYFATLYLRREWFGEGADDLDAFLAYAPWRSKRATWVYQEACKRKAVRPLIGLMGLHPSAWPSPPSPEGTPSDQVKRRKAVRKVTRGKAKR